MTDFYGHRVGVLENEHLRLEYLADGGPRLVRLFPADSRENILGEFPENHWETDEGRFEIFGGHRLWAAPELPSFSYLPDSQGLIVRESNGGVELHWEPGAAGFAKTMLVSLNADSPAIHITHRVTNRFDHKVRAAAWGITCLPLGGTAFMPSAQPSRSPELWPYSSANDPRLKVDPLGVRLLGEKGLPPLKAGTFARPAACAYLRGDTLLLKRFVAPVGEYPDGGCNVESYCSDLLIELETLSPLVDLEPGESSSYEETWEIYRGDEARLKLAEIFPQD